MDFNDKLRYKHSMFTGIIQSTAKIQNIEHLATETKLFLNLKTYISSNIKTANNEIGSSDIALGESIAINGVCLTVAEKTQDTILFYISPETRKKSNLGLLTLNSAVNIERALRVGDSLSGHFVQGHVDGLAKLQTIKPEGESHKIEVTLPPELVRYCVVKGSIALNGISLTINEIHNSTISLQIVPHTWQNTNLAQAKPGDFLNIEVDILAKYIENLCKK